MHYRSSNSLFSGPALSPLLPCVFVYVYIYPDDSLALSPSLSLGHFKVSENAVLRLCTRPYMQACKGSFAAIAQQRKAAALASLPESFVRSYPLLLSLSLSLYLSLSLQLAHSWLIRRYIERRSLSSECGSCHGIDVMLGREGERKRLAWKFDGREEII